MQAPVTWEELIGDLAKVKAKDTASGGVSLGLKASFGSLSRVTYLPVTLRGERTVGPTPWGDPGVLPLEVRVRHATLLDRPDDPVTIDEERGREGGDAEGGLEVLGRILDRRPRAVGGLLLQHDQGERYPNPAALG